MDREIDIKVVFWRTFIKIRTLNENSLIYRTLFEDLWICNTLIEMGPVRININWVCYQWGVHSWKRRRAYKKINADHLKGFKPSSFSDTLSLIVPKYSQSSYEVHSTPHVVSEEPEKDAHFPQIPIHCNLLHFSSEHCPLLLLQLPLADWNCPFVSLYFSLLFI